MTMMMMMEAERKDNRWLPKVHLQCVFFTVVGSEVYKVDKDTEIK